MKNPQHYLWSPYPCNCENSTHDPAPPNDSPQLDANGIKFIQVVAGSFLYYCQTTNTTFPKALSSNGTYTSMVHKIFWLNGHTSRLKDLMLLIRNDPECTLQCLISQHSHCMQPHHWHFLPWLPSTTKQTYSPQWCTSCPVHNPTICHYLHHWSQTVCPLPQCKRGKNNAARPWRAWPPTTSHPHPCG